MYIVRSRGRACGVPYRLRPKLFYSLGHAVLTRQGETLIIIISYIIIRSRGHARVACLVASALSPKHDFCGLGRAARRPD